MRWNFLSKSHIGNFNHFIFYPHAKETYSHGHTFKWTTFSKSNSSIDICLPIFFSPFTEVLAGLHGFFDDMAGDVSDSDDSIMDEEMSDDDDADVDALLFFPDF